MSDPPPVLPPCSECWRPIDPTRPHRVLVEQTETHDRPGADPHITVSGSRVLTARHAECP